MYISQVTRLLLVALSATSVAHAMVVNPEIVDREVVDVMAEDGQLLRRQTTSPSSSPTRSPSPTTSDPRPTTSPTSSPRPTSSTPTPSPSPSPSPTTSSPPQPTDKSSEPPKTSESTPTTQPTLEPSTSTVIITTHASDGSPTTLTSVGVQTPTAALSNGSGSAPTSEMSQDTKNIIIGTVVGIGGAIVLGVAGYLAWRIWGKKKAAEENDGLMSYGGEYPPEAKSETTGSTTTRTPFQSTLESYHAPTQVNTASNF